MQTDEGLLALNVSLSNGTPAAIFEADMAAVLLGLRDQVLHGLAQAAPTD